MGKILLRGLAASCLFPMLLHAPAQAQSPAGPSLSESPPEYRINPGDELEVHVWGEERLQREVKVLPDGTFAFPLVGQVNAGGKSPTEIQAAIARGLQVQYRGEVPQVTVAVRSAAGLQFSVVGRVRTPGTFTPGRYVNVLEALSFAGGPTEFANLRNVMIVRKGTSGLPPVRVRLSEWFRGGRKTPDGALPQLQGGDTVVVP
jgi:polysaccharide export outer membrane protein